MNKGAKAKISNKSKKEIYRIVSYYNLIKKDDYKELFKTPFDVLSLLRFTDMQYTILHLAVCLKAKQVLKAICENPSISKLIQARDGNGDTPYELAVFCKNFEAYQILREHEGNRIDILTNRPEFNVIRDPTPYKEFLEKSAETFRDIEASDLLTKIAQISPRKVDVTHNHSQHHSYRYDVKNPSNPENQWQWSLDEDPEPTNNQDGPHIKMNNLENPGAGTRRKANNK